MAASSQLMILSKRLTLFSFEGRIVDASYNAAALKLWQTTSLILNMIEFILIYKRVGRGRHHHHSKQLNHEDKVEDKERKRCPISIELAQPDLCNC
jgi:hypothetical protein